jgi:AmiR/NasT family two-component response regulator
MKRAAPAAAASEPPASPAPPPRWRIVVIDDHVPSRALVRAAVARAGGAVVAEADTAGAGLDLVARERPDAAVIAVGLPDGDGIDAAAEVERRYPCPVVVLTSHAAPDVIARARRAGAMAYLVKPLRQEELAPAVELAIARFAELARAGREADTLRRALEGRKTIERAKGLLMDRLGLTEATAFRLLQKSAMDRRTPIVALAERVLAGEDLAAQPDRR